MPDTNLDDVIFKNPDFPRVFAFTKNVASVFDNMAERSIPLYSEMHRQLVKWVLSKYQPGSIFYDVGCSTGKAIEKVLLAATSPMHVIGIDDSAPMIEIAEKNLLPFCKNHEISLRTESVTTTEYNQASVIALNYTLQFVDVDKRPVILKRMYESLIDGGILFFSEKIRSADDELQKEITRLYEEFKLANGYTAEEITRKRAALENILVPLTIDENLQMLKNAGFTAVQPILQWNQFVTWVARKHT